MSDDEIAAYSFTIVKNYFHQRRGKRSKEVDFELSERDIENAVDIDAAQEALFRELEYEDVKHTLRALTERQQMIETDYARADDAQWKKMFFGSADAPVKDEWAGWDLERNQGYYPELEHNYSLGDVSAHYSAYVAGITSRYKEKEVLL